MSERIEVHIRINPRKQNNVWKHTKNKLIRIFENKEVLYENFVNILYEENNLEVYKKCISEKIKKNTNCTVFAYGQTGSGKTYTMLGNKCDGMIMLSLQELLVDRTVSVSYIEIYNEKVFDLFTGKELKLYFVDNKTVINGLSNVILKDMQNARDFIEKSEQNRKYGSTEFNTRSSRSHTIFQISYNNTTINLIDLAGSEKASSNENRRSEGAFINKSLLALCTVVNNLQNKKFLGFRDSKLTRILQNSLDGNTNIIALCAISPSNDCIEESISTLNFGARLTNLELKKIITVTEKKENEILIKPEFNNETKSKKNLEKEYLIDQFMKLNLKENEIITDMDIKKNTQPFLNLKPFKNDKESKIKLYENRIEILEDMILKMFKKYPNKNLKDIFILEKHMFNLKIKKYEN